MSRNIIFLRVPRCGSASLTQWCQKNQIVDIYGGRDGVSGPVETYTIKNLFAHLKDESLSKRVERKLDFSIIVIHLNSPLFAILMQEQ